MLLAQSIVPWTAEWLFYYEMWQVTGAWGGDEAEHDTPPATPTAPVERERLRPLRAIDAPVMRSFVYLMKTHLGTA